MMMIRFPIFVLALSAVAAPADEPAPPELLPVAIGAPVRIEVFPPAVALTSARQRAHVAVTGYYADGSLQDLTRAAKLVSDVPGIVKADGGVLVPVADGEAVITVAAGGRTADVSCVVSGHGKADPVSFRNEAIAALTKGGCNSGACHGSPSGKGGFSLSMIGTDPEFDRRSLVRGGLNRRTNTINPEKSLLLRKPLMLVSHGGGQRLRPTDAAYRALLQWLDEGAGADPAGAPRLTKLEVFPSSGRVLRRPAHTQQLVVLAHLSDGSIRDVTALASYSSSEEALATVTADGLVVGNGRGPVAISVRYLDELVTRDFTFVADVPGFTWNDPKSANYVDDLVHEQLRLLNYLPSPDASDGAFVRRVFLDVTGLLPTAEEAKAFVADPAAAKRAKLIDDLLARPEHARFWARKTADLLRVNPKRLTDAGAKRYNEWIAASVADNQPYDKFVAALLTAEGNTDVSPAANYYRAFEDTSAVTEATAQLFMGVRIACAKCHNHPFERWTQDNYYGIGAVFNRVRRVAAPAAEGKDEPKAKAKKPKGGKTEPGAMNIVMAKSAELHQPRTGQVMKPWLPLVGVASIPPGGDERAVFAHWLTAPDNPFFARVEVNRIWAQLVGRGIVEPVDDFRASNPPSNAKLLDALAADFVKGGYDRRRIIRVILNSRTYQRSIERNAFNETDRKHFSAAQVRLLSAEQLLDAVCRVTGVDEKFSGIAPGTPATQLPTPAKSGFLTAFGQPERETACQCERMNEPTLEQALQLLNGPTVVAKVQSGAGRVAKLIKAGNSDSDILAELWWAALSRPPTAAETERTLKYLSARPERKAALEDVLWALLNTKEFLFQH